ncbi:hypothetical protein SAMN06266787_11624 [Halorubrum ezzemoulense]|uniref:Uncharacterized protein n=1 Tax=Halorubrum ezzemoulense TaxID=337243 RepID=A0A238YQT8_HALEZ|nr:MULTISPECIES: hypothetical protein [Halorubrum]TKX64106.1 hypothetical protein EXE47_12815 [Halorubrum sp. GN12_10-3_MGM]SNR73061.1 hypothetical protein SAMN06266787_11624 [Halorubrum ezzemoulense]
MRYQATTVLIVALVLGSAMGAPLSVSAQEPVRDVVVMSADYDETTPSQEIRVRLTIEPTDAKLSDIRVDFRSGAKTLIQTSSYASTVTPSNHDVSIRSEGRNAFVVPELDPGEKVTIAFSVVPSTLGERELTSAVADIEFSQNGQRLDAQISEQVELADNPWDRAQSSSRPTWSILLGWSAAGGILVGVATMIVYRRRQRSVVERVQSTLEQEVASIKRAGNQTVKRRADQLMEEIDRTVGRESADEQDETDSGSVVSKLAEVVGLGGGGSEGDRDGPNL